MAETRLLKKLSTNEKLFIFAGILMCSVKFSLFIIKQETADLIIGIAALFLIFGTFKNGLALKYQPEDPNSSLIGYCSLIIGYLLFLGTFIVRIFS